MTPRIPKSSRPPHSYPQRPVAASHPGPTRTAHGRGDNIPGVHGRRPAQRDWLFKGANELLSGVLELHPQKMPCPTQTSASWAPGPPSGQPLAGPCSIPTEGRCPHQDQGFTSLGVLVSSCRLVRTSVPLLLGSAAAMPECSPSWPCGLSGNGFWVLSEPSVTNASPEQVPIPGEEA